MQIKSAQSFRSTWCKEQGYTMEHWDENFIGSNAQNGKSGFYKMVNGIVDNIKADLTPKLQNAQDEQAMYEFLQNAADSQSTECAIIYDEQYFMVLNNGKPFSEKDLKALLNSFQGTKADKTKPENCGKIGRYGIGFKLAYRLLGKSDGADELVRDLAGPLLFSWHNQTQLDALLAYQKGENLTFHNDIQSSESAWLLKIILACFPTALGEEVKDLDYKPQTLFKPEELDELVAFLQKHKAAIQKLSLGQGSMFFLKFGAKKYEKLKESLINIKSGIGYAMNTLKTLQKVALQEEVIARYPVVMENFSITPESEEFKRIDPEFPFCPIDISLGFLQDTAHAVSLKSAPSIYQFFPMRNERHSLAFFVHSTSFAKITDRTRLDDQGEANIETFKYIAQALKKKLNKYKTDNFERYALIYKALLLSDRSKEYDAPLLNTHFYEPLLQYIQTNIPTRKNNAFAKDLVIIKGTNLPIEPMQIGIGKEWFYWTNPQDEAIQKDAANNAKLGLRLWTLRDLLMEGNPELINTWLEELEDEDYALFMQELGQIKLDSFFSNKLKQLKCFKFKDNKGKTNFYAIEDLKQAENIFLISEKTASIASAIKALGFSTLELKSPLTPEGGTAGSLEILKQLASQLDYLTNEKALFTKIVNAINSPLTPEGGTQADSPFGGWGASLLSFFKSLKTIKEEEFRQVPLFKNRAGKLCKLAELLPMSAEVPIWLEGYKISEITESEDVTPYLVSKDSWELYANIIKPEWENIISLQNALSEHIFKDKKYNFTEIPDTATLARADESVLLENQLASMQKAVSDVFAPAILELYEFTIKSYSKKAGQPKLGNVPLVFVDESIGFQEAGKVLYKKSLESLSPEAYQILKSAVWKAFSLHLPAQEILPFLVQEPFKLADFTADKDWKTRLQTYVQSAQSIKLSGEERQLLFAIIYNALPLKEAVSIPIFESQNKRILPTNQLIFQNETDLEEWFEGYKVHSIENELLSKEGILFSAIKEELQKLQEIQAKEHNLFITKNYIYNHIVLNDWVNLTAQKSLQKNVGKFYESILKYAQIGKATKPLTSLPYIFVDEKMGFVNAGQVFYHSNLPPSPSILEGGKVSPLQNGEGLGEVKKVSPLQNGEGLGEVLKKLTGLPTPHPEAVAFLQEPIFKTKENSLTQSLLKEETFTATKDEILALQKFLDQTNENFFEIFVVEESENNTKEYILRRKNPKITAVYLDKNQQGIAEKVREMYGEQYKILPTKLFLPTLRNKGLLQGAPLFELLSKDKNMPADMLTTMLAESGNAELQQKVFSKIDKIVLKQGVTYEKGSFEHQALQIFRNKDADFGALRAKIFVEASPLPSPNERELAALNTIAFEPTVSFSLEKVGKFTLQLAEILPAFAEHQAFLEEIFAQIQDYEAPNSLKKRCFEYEERSANLIFNDLKKSFVQLENTAQLAFLWLYAKANNQEKILKDFQILNQTGEWIGLGEFEMWHTKGADFIEPRAILSQEHYVGLAEILHLNEKRGAFEVGNQRIVIEPYFEKDVFYASPKSPLTPEGGTEADSPFGGWGASILTFAYQKWINLEENARPDSITLYGVSMGFEFQDLVYPKFYATNSEDLPHWLKNWVEKDFDENDLSERTALRLSASAEEGEEILPTKTRLVADKIGFLQALGVHINDSVTLMRHYLEVYEDGVPITQKQINDLRNTPILLENTILYLYENSAYFEFDDERVAGLRKIYNSLDNIQGLPIPYLTTITPKAVEPLPARLIYGLKHFYEGELYALEAKQQGILAEKYGISLVQVLEAVGKEGIALTNIELKGIEPKTSKIEEILSLETLQENSQEWGASHYMKWREETPYRIYLYAGEMPYQLRFCDTNIATFERDNAVLCEEIVYVNKNVPNIEEELFKITKSATFSEHLVLQLLRYKNETVKETKHTIIEKIVEQVVVEDSLQEDEELIENPDLETVKNAKKKPKTQLKVALNLEDLPEELLEQIMQYAQKSKVIMKKEA
jgi:hypothetical protein